jgi:hypothetical protein
MTKFFYTDGQVQYGPFSKEELCSQNITRRTKVWCYGMDGWTEVINVPELSEVLSSFPPDLSSRTAYEPFKASVEPRPIASQEQVVKSTQRERKKKPFSPSKWLIAGIVLIVASFLIYHTTNNRAEVRLRNEIIANSYDGDEDFDVYVEKFYRDLAFHGIHPKRPMVTIIKFSKLDQMDNATHIHALSLGSDSDDRIEIYINPSTWKQFNKPMRYYLMYHELSHDVLNLDDLESETSNEGKLMYPELSRYSNKTMDDFIESFHALFKEHSMESK